MSFQEKLNELAKRRAAAPPLPGGSGPFTSSDHFRAAPDPSKPVSRSWEDKFSEESKSQFASELKIASRGGGSAGLVPRISLGTGRPATHYFPWDRMLMSTAGAGPGVPPESMSSRRGDADYDLDIALNYGFSAGAPQTLRWVTEHVELIHNPPYRDWACSVTCGSTSGLDIALRLMCDRGDWVLAEEYTYPGTTSAARAQGLRLQGVAVDDEGISPVDLRRVLEGWDESRGKRPSVLYMIPCGQNPTGTTQTRSRHEQVYQVAEEYDLYILEDDPYYFLNLGEDETATKEDNVERFISRLPASYLSLDRSGRVMRLDSTSKVLAPGLRFGWVTAAASVIDKFIFQAECGVLSPSGPSQVLVYKLLDEAWGHRGFISWLVHLSSEYTHRRNVLVGACRKYLPSDVCHWAVPASGMFLWLREPCLPGGVGAAGAVADDSFRKLELAVYTKGLEQGVLVSKGSWFALSDDRITHEANFRLSFATAADAEMIQAVWRLSTVIRSQMSTENQ